MSEPRSGAGSGMPAYISEWEFYEDMMFLAEHITGRRTTSNMSMTMESSGGSAGSSTLSSTSQTLKIKNFHADSASYKKPCGGLEMSILSDSCDEDPQTSTQSTDDTFLPDLEVSVVSPELMEDGCF